jgi:hypothetical protein
MARSWISIPELSFKPTSYLDGSNRQSRCFDMDRDGFTLLSLAYARPPNSIAKASFLCC